MFVDNPIVNKIIVLTITRLALLAGAILLRPRCHVIVSALMLTGAVALVLTGFLGIGIATGSRLIEPFGSAVQISSMLEIGGWIAFSSAFLAFAITKHKIAKQPPACDS